MILAMDIGNSNVVIGLWKDSVWKHIWRLESRVDDQAGIFYSRSIAELLLEHSIASSEIKKLIVSSVVPDLNQILSLVLEQIFSEPAHFIGPESWSSIKLMIDRPTEIGSDLVCNALAALKLYKTDCLVVDFGTALTFTSVLKEYKLLGVAIAPGLKTAMKSLYGNTAQLPEVPVQMPASVIGKNTNHAVQAGVIRGYYGLVHEMIVQTRKEAGRHLKVIATGGLSVVLQSYYPLFDEVNTELTLDGLRFMATD